MSCRIGEAVSDEPPGAWLRGGRTAHCISLFGCDIARRRGFRFPRRALSGWGQRAPFAHRRRRVVSHPAADRRPPADGLESSNQKAARLHRDSSSYSSVCERAPRERHRVALPGEIGVAGEAPECSATPGRPSAAETSDESPAVSRDRRSGVVEILGERGHRSAVQLERSTWVSPGREQELGAAERGGHFARRPAPRRDRRGNRGGRAERHCRWRSAA